MPWNNVYAVLYFHWPRVKKNSKFTLWQSKYIWKVHANFKIQIDEMIYYLVGHCDREQMHKNIHTIFISPGLKV